MPSLTEPVKTPNLSVVVLAWNKLELTRRCVDSIRSGTSGDYELIVVDNGSTDGGAEYATAAADKAVINSENLGFAAGNNSGLAVATGTYVAFVNNDTVLPAGWDVSLTEILDTQLQTGMVLPAVTAAGNPVTVRNEPGDTVETLLPFGEFPSGVVVVLRRSQMEALGGWNEAYRASQRGGSRPGLHRLGPWPGRGCRQQSPRGACLPGQHEGGARSDGALPEESRTVSRPLGRRARRADSGHGR